MFSGILLSLVGFVAIPADVSLNCNAVDGVSVSS